MRSKVKIMIWWAFHDALPSRGALLKRGCGLPSHLPFWWAFHDALPLEVPYLNGVWFAFSLALATLKRPRTLVTHFGDVRLPK